MSRSVLVLALLVAMLSGCVATGAVKPTTAEAAAADSIVDLVMQYRSASQAGLINLEEPFAKATSNESVRMFNGHWCLKPSASIEELTGLVQAHCSARGGVLEMGWCTAASGDLPLYKAEIGRGADMYKYAGCSSASIGPVYVSIGVSVVEPLEGADFPSLATANGFKPRSVRQTEAARARQKAEIEAQMAHEREQVAREVHRQQAPARRQIGARICKVVGDIRYIGYVEARSPDNDRVQIRVSFAEQVGSPGFRPGGFEPSVVWDSPDLWTLCD